MIDAAGACAEGVDDPVALGGELLRPVRVVIDYHDLAFFHPAEKLVVVGVCVHVAMIGHGLTFPSGAVCGGLVVLGE